jgi:hypothetical protein
MGNYSLTKLINRRCTKEDVLKIVDRFRSYKGSLEYSHTPSVLVCIAGVLMMFPGSFELYKGLNSYYYHPSSQPYFVLWMVMLVVGLLTAVFSLLLICERSAEIPSLSNQLLRIAGVLNFPLSQHHRPYDESLRYLQSAFGDFDRGNYSRQLLMAYNGKYKGARHQLSFEHFCLEYVNERVEPVVVSNGKTTTVSTRIVYDTFYRYSIVVDFPWVKNVKVQADGQTSFRHKLDTAHPDFNRIFKVSADDSVTGVKFLKPTTVLHVLAMADNFGDLNIELSHDGKLCMSFNNDNMMTPFPQGLSLNAPADFYTAVERGIQFHHLKYALEQIHILAEQHDDNFSN